MVLILNSYHLGYPFSDCEVAGAMATLAEAPSDIDVRVEYLDAKHFVGNENLQDMKKILLHKYKQSEFSLLMAMDNVAFEFALDLREALCPNVPVVFCGVNNYAPSMIEGHSGVTGIEEILDAEGTVEVMLGLHPNTREILLIHDDSVTGLASRDQAQTQLARFRSKVNLRSVDPLTMEELTELMGQLSPGTLGLILTYARDRDGKVFKHDVVARLLSESSSVPIYATHEARLGHGIVGGSLIGGREHGSAAAAIAVRVLSGEDISRIPVIRKPTTRLMFDFRQMQRFSIPVSGLPEGSVVINKPRSFYEEYTATIWVSAGIFLGLCATIVVLATNIARRRRAEHTLRVKEHVIRSASNPIVTTDTEGKLTYVNPAFLKAWGFDDVREILGRPFPDFWMVEERLDEIMEVLLRGEGEWSDEIQARRKDGILFDVHVSAAMVYDERGRPVCLMLASVDITERNRAAEGLRRIEHIVSSSTDMLAMLDENYVYLAANEAYLKAFNKTRDELIGYTAAQIFGQEFFDTTIKPHAERCLAGEGVHYEDWFDFPFSGRQYMDIAYSPYTIEDGQIKGFVVCGRVATDRKRAEEALRESEERFRGLFEESPLGIGLIDSYTGQIYEVNPRFAEIAGRTRAEMSTIDWMSITHPDDVQEDLDSMALLNAGKIPGFNTNKRYRRPNGSFVWINMTIAQITVEDKSHPRHLCMIDDITDRKRAEEALREAEALNAEVVSCVGEGIVVYNREFKYLVWNAFMERMTGVSAEEVLGQVSLDLFPHLREQGIDLLLERALAGETVCSPDTSFRVPETGKTGWVVGTYSPHRNSHGDIVGVIAAVHNITERKRAAEEREELITKLESQNAELERFTYTVSHDLKSPLITIKGYVGMLRKDLIDGDSERAEDDLSRVSNAADKMEQLLRDVLELSRIGRLVDASEDVSLEEVAHDAHELVSGQTGDNGVQVEISSDLPVVFGDRLRLREVLQNLIDNAVKYMGDQPQPRVEIGSRRDGNETICYVQDNGIGIDSRYHERVFGLFDQLDPKVEGSGIGLSLVKRIIEIHGGRIWVESEGSGHGSTFCFTIAARSESRDHQEAE